MKKPLLVSILAVAGILVLVAVFIGAGFYNVGADDEHSAPVHRLLATVRDRSIAVRAADIDVPDLADPQRARRGAGNYDSMCAGCHLSPGAQETEVSRGLYPKPPELARSMNVDPARAFWVIKHGLKASGMPAWGKSMDDASIWNMVALLEKLPRMSSEQYRAEVRASGGHSHGGGETMDHSHEEGEEGHSHADEEEDQSSEHSHTADGRSYDAAGEDESAAHEPSDAEGERQLANAASTDPIAVVEAFHNALSAGSKAKVETMLDPKVLIMEGGNVERSRQEYASHHLPSDLQFMSAVHYRLERQTGDTVGDLAWVASEARLTGESSGKTVDLLSTESLVLRKRAGGWKIVHIHWSSRNAKKA